MNRKQRKAFYAQTKNHSLREVMATAHSVVLKNYQHPATSYELEVEAEVLDGFDWSAPVFHGGLSGRRVGDLLLPGNKTGCDPHAWGDPEWRRDSVYCTPAFDNAQWYANKIEGEVYRVQLNGKIGLDIADIRILILLLESPQMRKYSRQFGSFSIREFFFSEGKFSLICESATVLEVLS